MKFYVVAGVAAVSLMGLSPASADDCAWNGRFTFGKASTGSASVKSGQDCSFTIRTGGAVKSVKIVTPANNGTARAVNQSTFAYKPKAGFKGRDSFVIAVDGSGQKGSGVSNVTMAITVQ
jgi:hypothetical protein